MKRIAITFAVIIFVLVAGALIAPQFMDWNAYRARIAEKVKTATGFELKVDGDLDVAVLPYPRLSAGDITLRSPRSDIPVLKLKGVSFDIAVMPLFSSHIEVNSLQLDSPELALKILPDGNGNWMTDKLAGFKDKSGQARQQERTESTTLSALYQRIGLQNVSIQNGNARFINAKSGREYALRQFNADIDAKTLFGPYNIDAHYRFQDKRLTADAKIGRYTRNQTSLPLKITLKAETSDAGLDYSGVVDFGQDAPVLQGEAALAADKLEYLVDLAPFDVKLPEVIIEESLSVQTMVTAEAARTRFEDLKLTVGPMTHSGHVNVIYDDPQAIRFDTQLLPKNDAKNDEDSKASLAMPWQALVQSGIEGQAIIKPLHYALRDANLVTDDQRHSIELIYKRRDGDSKPTLDIDVDGGRLDLDTLGVTTLSKDKSAGKSAQGNAGGDHSLAVFERLEDGLDSPLHINAEIGFDTVQAMGRNIEKPAAKIKLRYDRLNIDNIGAANAYNANWQLQGRVADISNMSGIDIKGRVETGNLGSLAKAFLGKKADAYDLSGEATARLGLEGATADLDFTSNLKAMRLNAEASGRIEDALTAPALASGSFRIRHPDSAELVQIAAPEYKASSLLQHPVDVYGEFVPDQQDGYQFNKISGRVLGTNIQGELGGHLNESGKPSLEGDLEFTKLDLTGAMQASEHDDAEPGQAQNRENKDKSSNKGKSVVFSRKAIDLSALHALDLKFNMQGGQLLYSGWRLDSPVFALSLKDGTLTINKAKGKLFGGPVELSGTVKAGAQKGEGHAITLDGNAENINARALSSTMLGSQLNVLDGEVTLDSELKTSGISPAALVLALKGSGSITSSDFIINGIELNALAHALREDVSTQDAIDNLTQFMRSPFRGGKTRFTGINGEYKIDKGLINLKNTKLEAKGFIMQSKGDINLPRWKMDLMNTVSFPAEKDVPSFDIIVRGPLDDPARGLRDQMMRNYLEKRLQKRAQRFITDELNQLFGSDLKAGAPSGSQTQKDTQDKPEDKQENQSKESEKGKTPDKQDKSAGDSQIKTIKPDKMKDNNADNDGDDDSSRLEKITPEDAVKGVLDRLK